MGRAFLNDLGAAPLTNYCGRIEKGSGLRFKGLDIKSVRGLTDPSPLNH